MQLGTASRLIRTISTNARIHFGLIKWLLREQDRRADAKRERELERAIRKSGLSILLEPEWEVVRRARSEAD
jgi:hypothetical protein